jgi:hypothetical protein
MRGNVGASHYVANAGKRRFSVPGKFDNGKGSGLLRGLGGHALALLIAGRLGPPAEIGCWAGDPLFIITDDTVPVWSSQLAPEYAADRFSDYEIVDLAYTDVTYPVLAGLGQRSDLTEILWREASRQRVSSWTWQPSSLTTKYRRFRHASRNVRARSAEAVQRTLGQKCLVATSSHALGQRPESRGAVTF